MLFQKEKKLNQINKPKRVPIQTPLLGPQEVSKDIMHYHTCRGSKGMRVANRLGLRG